MAVNKERIPNITIEDTRLLFRNFEGKQTNFNTLGNRNFNVVLTPELADHMSSLGFNVRELPQRDEDERPTPVVKVIVKFGGLKPPRLVMITSRGRTTITEDEANIFDWADIKHVDLIISPYQSENAAGQHFTTAYLQSIFVTIEEDELDLKYADIPDADISSKDSRVYFED